MQTLARRTGTPVVAVVCLAILSAVRSGLAQDWPQFRGVQGGVAADHPSLPDTWSETQNVVWKIDLPGRGWSSPIVWGGYDRVAADPAA